MNTSQVMLYINLTIRSALIASAGGYFENIDTGVVDD